MNPTTQTWPRSRSVVLEAITPIAEPFVAGLLEREARWFHFLKPPDFAAQHDTEANYLATVSGYRVGFGRLAWLEHPGVLLGSYAVHEQSRRQGFGRDILLELHAIARERDRPFACAVFAANAPSLSLCASHFGPPLFEGEDPGGRGTVYTFGDLAAQAALLEL